MQVTICGPNLPDQSKGQFHVHAAGCKDIGKLRRYGVPTDTIEAATILDVAEFVYSCQIDEHVEDEPERSRDEIVGDFVDDFHCAPCCSTLYTMPSEPARERFGTE